MKAPLTLILLWFLFAFSVSAQTAQKPRHGLSFWQGGFIENKGQIVDQNGKANLRVKYLLHVASGMNLQLRANSFSYDSYISDESSRTSSLNIHNKNNPDFKPSKNHFQFQRVDITMPGSNPNPRIIATDTFNYHYNYFNPGSGHNRLQQAQVFGQICYKNIYPHIDLIIASGNRYDSSKTEYYFVVGPGGNVQSIQLHYSGADYTSLIENKIQVGVQKGIWKEQIPESFLNEGTSTNISKTAGKQQVMVRYRQIANDTYGFETGTYDHSKTLVIDPTPDLIWGTYLGDDLNDWSQSIAKDSQGNIFIGGSSDNANNIATAGAYKTVLDGFGDAILGKFSSAGQPFWITYYGGENEEVINGLAVDGQDNVVGVGYTFSFTNIATPGSFKTTKISPNGSSDAFIVKFSNAGNLLWCTYYGGDSVTQSSGVAIDNNDNIYIAAWTGAANGIASPGAYQTNYGGGYANDADDGCVAKFSPVGAMIWSTYYGGTSFDRFYGIAIDKAQNLYLTGPTASPDHIATAGSYQPVLGGGTGDAFLVKFNLNGVPQWATYYGGSGQDYSSGVCTDQVNNIYIGGLTFSQDGIATAGTQPWGGGDRDLFIAKFSPAGQRIWGTYAGGNSEEALDAITSDYNNNIYITGYTISNTGIATPGVYQTTPNPPGYWNTYLMKFDSGAKKQWGTYYGIQGPYGEGEGLAVLTTGDTIYVTGYTTNTQNIATCDAYQKNWVNNLDIFIGKFGTAFTPTIGITANNNLSICAGKPVQFTATVQNVGSNPVFQWYWNGAPVGTDDSLYTNNQFAEGDSVRCTVQKNSACGVNVYSSNSLIVHVDPGLPVAVSVAGPTTDLCQGDTAKFNAAPVNAGQQPFYQWQVNGINAGGDSPAFVSSSLKNGDIITCTVTRYGSCTVDSIAQSNSVSVRVKNISIPQISISAMPDPVCSGDTVVFTASVVNAVSNMQYQWELNGNPVGANDSVFTISKLKDGDEIYCNLTASDSGCSVNPILSNQIVETVFSVPHVSITGDSIISKGSSASIVATVTGSGNNISWNASPYLSDVNILNPVATPPSSMNFTLQVTTPDGCVVDKSFYVTVLTKISIPNAFTPNGDGKNDVFRALYGTDISAVTFSIYNRWGQLVFEDQGTHKGWDGTFGGSPQPEGTYVYEFKYKDHDGNNQLLSGAFLLIR